MSNSEPVPQAGAIPLRGGRVCLITSSDGLRWQVPKGMIDHGDSFHDSAHKEAWEEAGVRGKLHDQPAGSYRYDKEGTLCEVTLYVMHVTFVADDWPEKEERRRRWAELDEALDAVANDGLRDVLQKLKALDEI
jgi:8-oxo-dGTP pyrophosphatase MutT (NUDIX family)